MELEDMFRVKRVSDPQVSPDGKWVAYVVTEVDKANNKTNSDIWLIPASGGAPRKLTDTPKHDRHPRWSPDSKLIAFESNRTGAFQIYVADPTGGEAQQLTNFSTEATGACWASDGKSVACISAVFPEFSDKPFNESDKLNKQKQDARDASNVKGRVFDKLLYRHWASWVDGKRQHVFLVPLDATPPRDLTPGDRDGAPTSSTFSAGDDYDFSPDGKELAYTATPVPVREEAWSTNHDIYTVNLQTGERKQLTTNMAADGYPRYSPDGRYIAYRAQAKPGFEADRWQLMLFDRSKGTTRSLTGNFDADAGAFLWRGDGERIFFPSQEKGEQQLWTVSLKGGDVAKVVSGGVNSDPSLTRDGRKMVMTRQWLNRAAEVGVASLDRGGRMSSKTVAMITHTNDDLFAQLSLSAPENLWFDGDGGTKVQMWLVKPPGFDPAKKYPLVFWVHGGPQSAFLNSWSTRWNAEMWAAQGYIIAMPNPRGSTGFGQKFVDEISHDWGGKVYRDLMAGLDKLVTFSFVDTTRMATAGASFGGYMMNWFNGHTDRFKAIICHDGVFNFSSMYAGTEEIWFDEWEHGIPWETPEFDRYSPNKFAMNFKTPTLIIHSEQDFRVPVSEGMQLFTTLQRKGIESKFLYFPDEGHWVLKPGNSELWHTTIFDWLARHIGEQTPSGSH
jgi:dipeptidyl aminopeptidase/acylaminoacyl peptidase